MTGVSPIGRRVCRDCRAPLMGSSYLCGRCLAARLDRPSRKDRKCPC